MSKAATRYIPMSYYDNLEHARKTLRENSLLALEDQISTLAWMESPDARDFFSHFMRSYGNRTVDDEGLQASLGKFLHDKLRSVLSSSPTYYVTPDMCEVARMAAEELPPEGLGPLDLLTPTGFMVLGRPITIIEELPHPSTGEVTLQNIPLKAVAWEHGSVRIKSDAGHWEDVPGISYYLYCDFDFEWKKTDWSEQEAHRTIGPIPLYDYSGWAYGVPWTTVEENWPTHLDSEDVEDEAEWLRGQVHPIVDQTRRLLLAIWKLLSEKMVIIDSERPYRALQRRASRYIPEMGDVVVIRLRREYHPTNKLTDEQRAEVGEAWWSHRWIVRGHWHRYYYGPGKSMVKVNYVMPYVKGPADAPLVIKDKIYSLEQ